MFCSDPTTPRRSAYIFVPGRLGRPIIKPCLFFGCRQSQRYIKVKEANGKAWPGEPEFGEGRRIIRMSRPSYLGTATDPDGLRTASTDFIIFGRFGTDKGNLFEEDIMGTPAKSTPTKSRFVCGCFANWKQSIQYFTADIFGHQQVPREWCPTEVNFAYGNTDLYTPWLDLYCDYSSLYSHLGNITIYSLYFRFLSR